MEWTVVIRPSTIPNLSLITYRKKTMIKDEETYSLAKIKKIINLICNRR